MTATMHISISGSRIAVYRQSCIFLGVLLMNLRAVDITVAIPSSFPPSRLHHTAFTAIKGIEIPSKNTAACIATPSVRRGGTFRKTLQVVPKAAANPRDIRYHIGWPNMISYNSAGYVLCLASHNCCSRIDKSGRCQKGSKRDLHV